MNAYERFEILKQAVDDGLLISGTYASGLYYYTEEIERNKKQREELLGKLKIASKIAVWNEIFAKKEQLLKEDIETFINNFNREYEKEF